MIQRALIGPSVKVYAGPFESTVGKMMQFGWSFETDYNHFNLSVSVYGRSRYGVFKSSSMETPYIESTALFPFLHFTPQCVIYADHIAERIEMPITDLMPVDVGEVYAVHQHKEIMYYDRKEVAVATEKDIIVTPEDIPDLLTKIQEAQKPRAKELLHKQRSRDKLKEYEVRAKILSFA